MTDHISTADPAQLSPVLDMIHDRWFDKDDITFDPEVAELRIPFRSEVPERKQVTARIGPITKTEFPLVTGVLTIHHVLSYRIEDEAQVGTYDINRIEYDPEENRVQVTTGVPILIEAIVDRFKVSVSMSDKVLATNSRWSIFE